MQWDISTFKNACREQVWRFAPPGKLRLGGRNDPSASSTITLADTALRAI